MTKLNTADIGFEDRIWKADFMLSIPLFKLSDWGADKYADYVR